MKSPPLITIIGFLIVCTFIFLLIFTAWIVYHSNKKTKSKQEQQELPPLKLMELLELSPPKSPKPTKQSKQSKKREERRKRKQLIDKNMEWLDINKQINELTIPKIHRKRHEQKQQKQQQKFSMEDDDTMDVESVGGSDTSIVTIVEEVSPEKDKYGGCTIL